MGSNETNLGTRSHLVVVDFFYGYIDFRMNKFKFFKKINLLKINLASLNEMERNYFLKPNVKYTTFLSKFFIVWFIT